MMQTEREERLKALMLAALDGDRRAYRALLGDLHARLTQFVGRRLNQSTDTEDLVQDMLLTIHTRRETYDRALPLLPWVYAIARYKLIDHYRLLGRRVFVPLDEIEPLAAPDERSTADARNDADWALSHLSGRAQMLVRSLKIEGLSIAQTADRTGMSEGAVKVALHRGLRALAKLRGPLGGEIGGGHD